MNSINSLRNKILRNVFSNFIGVFVALVVGFFLMPFVIHHIGQTAFGIWILITSLTGYTGLLTMGLRPTIVKKSAEYLAKDDKQGLNKTISTIFMAYLSIGITLGIAIFVLSFVLHQVFNIRSEDIDIFRTLFWIVGLQTAISFPMSIWEGLMSGLQDFHIINGIAIVVNLIRAVVTVFLLWSGFGLISLVWLNLGLAMAAWLVEMFWVRWRIPYLRIRTSRLELTKLKNLIRVSGAMFIWQIAGMTLLQGDRIIIGLFLPSASITIYEVGARIMKYCTLFRGSVLSVIMPAASELDAKAETIALQKLYFKGTRYLLMVYAGIVVALLLFGKEFILLWMGKGFERSVWIMYILIIGSLYQSQNVMAHVMLPGMGKLRVFTKVMIAYPIVNIILSIIFIMHWSLIGVALATSLTIFVTETYFIFYITKVFKIKLLSLLKRCHLSVIKSMIPAIVAIYYLKSIFEVGSWVGLSLGVFLFLLLYLLSFWILGMSSEERDFLKHRVLGMLYQLKLNRIRG